MLWIPIDRTSSLPLIRQIYLELRRQILQGELPAGQRLPATREFAAHLGVSRNVILEAYDQLMAEGYLEARTGAGTYVAQGAYWELAPVELATKEQLKSPPAHQATDVIDFRSGIPALECFPYKQWGQLTKQVCAETPSAMFGYGLPEGCPELRSVLEQYLWRSRGVSCHSEQIVITSGATQAFTLVAKLLVSPGDTVVIEDPVTCEIREIFSGLGAALYSIPVDSCGIQTNLLPYEKTPRFTLVTPSHQFPMGSVLTIQRRIELLQFAMATDGFVVEDDYDSEFRYEGTPVSSLQGLAPERVIYIGTFSKILSPAFRLGYLVLPPTLVERCRHLKRLSDLHTSSFEQLTLARFIQAGYLERHIRRMKKLYRTRRNVLKQNLNYHFSEQVRVLGDSTGLHLVAELAGIEFSAQVLRQVEQQRVRVYPVAAYAISPQQHRHQIILGYGNLTTKEIKIGIQRLKKALSAWEKC